MKVIVIGAVGTTALTIEKLCQHEFDVVGVLGHEPLNKNRVSGHFDLQTIALKLGLEYKGFQKINDKENIDWAEEKKADIIFAVGFSQLMDQIWFKITRLGCIGFHPTLLPKGRGRAPVAWSLLEEKAGAANFFLMGKGADDGPVFVQESFEISDDDDALSYIPKLRNAISNGLDKWLPQLKKGHWNPIEQDHSNATYYGKREPCDSLIDWNMNAMQIDRLIKASTFPHPGSFSFCKEKIITILKSHINKTHHFKGVIGRVLLVENDSLLIQCGGNTSLWIDKYEAQENLKLNIGDKLGTLYQNQLDNYINNYVWKRDE